MDALDKQIELLKACAERTDALNHRLIRAFKVQTIAFAIAIIIITYIAFSSAFPL